MKTTKILPVLFFLLFGFSNPIHAIPVKITIVFPYFTPQNVNIKSDFTNWNPGLPMIRITDRTYEYQADLSIGTYYLNFWFKLPPYHLNKYSHAVTSWEGYPRILYSKVYINNQLISGSFVRSDGNINFTVTNSGVVYPLSTFDAGSPIYDDRIPPEVDHPKDSIKTVNGVPGPNYTKVAGWVQVLHDNNFIEKSKIEVKSIKLYARIGDENILLDAADYSVTPFNPSDDGGLYFRYPFFVDPTSHTPMEPASVVNGLLTFHPSDHNDTVWHFWNPAYPLVPTNPNYTSYWFEVIYRITGQACIQVGIDFRDANENTFEGAVSKWKFESYGGQFDTLRVDTRPVVTSMKGMGEEDNGLRYMFNENYPNPFNSTTLISFQVPEQQNVKIILFDTLGQEISTLLNEDKYPGDHKLAFNGDGFASGVYYLKMVSGDYSKTQKLILLK